MKKVLALFLIFVFSANSKVNALEWAYWFVVHEGKVYEVKEEESIATNDVGKVIGKVETRADDYTGDYYGNASNYYKIGTRYFEINGVLIKEAIAIETRPNEYVKAIYKHDVPIGNKIINIFSFNFWMISGLVFFVFLFIIVLISRQR
ncbi:hypothetical protein ACFYKX_09255 [Cytobacillus sp. FJAT-54145]|uniref:DUF3592 domain-containing protein n=1 Tax=Cytobacillus spartinae TaxID=3299023 RepID=A0ABW6K9D8_9BACI